MQLSLTGYSSCQGTLGVVAETVDKKACGLDKTNVGTHRGDGCPESAELREVRCGQWHPSCSECALTKPLYRGSHRFVRGAYVVVA